MQVPPLRFQPLAGKIAKPQQSSQIIRKNIPALQQNVRANVKAIAKLLLPLARASQYKPFIFNRSCTPPLKPNPSQTLSKPLASKATMSSKPLARKTTFQKPVKKAHKAIKSSVPLARTIPTSGKSSQPEWRKVFDGSVSEALHVEYHCGCKKNLHPMRSATAPKGMGRIHHARWQSVVETRR